MQIKETTITKTLIIDEPGLQITLTLEEVKMLLTLGSTSQLDRKNFLEDNARRNGSIIFERCEPCAILLGDLFHAANEYIENLD
jgi:hypothetical protein